jgi:hypothetical protein
MGLRIQYLRRLLAASMQKDKEILKISLAGGSA